MDIREHTDGGFAMVTTIDEPKCDKNAENASDDVGNIAGAPRACVWNTTFWIDAHGRGLCVER